jgi:tRNA U54 and U55 pseudouridine synthase Pus10
LLSRYLKLKRGMPQSKWIDPDTGQRIGSVSLAERIEEAVLPLYGASESKFISGNGGF